MTKNYTTEELVNIREMISKYQSIGELKHDLDRIISHRKKDEKKRLNIRFDIDFMKKLKILDEREYILLRNHNIENLQELVKCNLEDLQLNAIDKEKIDWIRHFYDMSSLEKKKRK